MERFLLVAILAGLAVIYRKQKQIKLKLNNMPTKAEFDALKAEFNEGLTNIADDITRLAEAQNSGDLTADEEAQVYADLLETASRIRQIAGVTPEPETPPTEPETSEEEPA